MWAGHVARMVATDPKRITSQSLQYKDRSWLKKVEMSDGNVQKSQYHQRRFHVWRWEYIMYKKYESQGKDWVQESMDKSKWIEDLDENVGWYA